MKYLLCFEAFEIKSIPKEETEFKELIRKYDPTNFDKYFNLYKRKGLEIAKETLLKDAEQIAALQADVKRYRREEKRKANAKKKNAFGITKEDLEFYKLDKKKAKDYIESNLLADKELRRIYNRFGFHTLNGTIIDPDIDFRLSSLASSLNFESKTLTYDTKIDASVKLDNIQNLTIANMVSILESGTTDSIIIDEIIDENVFKELNEKFSGFYISKDFEISFTQDITPIWKKILRNEIYVKANYSIYNQRGTSNNYCVLNTMVHNELNDKFLSMHDDGAAKLLNKFHNKTVAAFQSVTKYLKHKEQLEYGDKMFANLKDRILDLCIDTLGKSGLKYYTYINLIKENYPNAWELISNKINDEEGLNKAVDMGDRGFGD